MRLCQGIHHHCAAKGGIVANTVDRELLGYADTTSRMEDFLSMELCHLSFQSKRKLSRA